ncbi:MAG: hypothetical protein K0S44_261 [Bacteroidetes bacterium]|jgi:hypothetical protein|nr:hypothetical protein [Bacteroidota bacterium]
MDNNHNYLPKSILTILFVLMGLFSQSHTFARNADLSSAFISDSLPFPTITSDQDDYPPLSDAYLSGRGFHPLENVIVRVVQFDENHPDGVNSGTWSVTADSAGNFETYWQVCNCIGATLKASADGQTSGLHAETIFTDADLTVSISGASSICTGTTTNYSANPSSGGGSYQWRRNGTNIGGATSSNYTASLAGTYDVVYIKSGVSAFSNTITLTIINPVLFSVTGGGTFCTGGAGVAVGLSGSETGLSYQLKRNGSNVGSPVAGTGAALSFGNQLLAGTYTVTVVGCATTMSGNASITISSRPTATITSSSTAICNGSSVNITGNVTATGSWSLTLNGDGVVTGSGNGSFTKNLSPSSTTTYSIASLADAACSSLSSDLSGSTTVTVNQRPTAVITSTDKDLCNGGSTNITGNVVASGHWTLSLNGDGTVTGNGNGTFSKSVTPSNTTTYTIGTLSDAKCTAIAADLSGSTTITVVQLSAATATPSSQTICSGDTITPIVLSGASSYSWTRTNMANVLGIPTSGTGNISGILNNNTTSARTVTFTITPTLSGCTGDPITATVTVNPLPVVTAQPANQSITYGSGASFTVAAAGMVSAYQWQEYAGSTWINVTDGGIYSGTNTPTLSLSLPTASMNNYKYRCIVSGSCPPNAISNEALLNVSQRPITVTVDPGQTKVYGQSDPASFAYQLTSGTLLSGDALSGTLSRTAGEDVNIYAINQNTLTAGPNYLITFISDNFSITHLNITGDFTVADKIYDGNTNATILTRTLIGNLPGDDVSLMGGSATFDNMNVGNGKVVTLTGMSLSGAKALNYNLLSVDTASADITLRSLTITVDPGQTKVYGQINPASYTYQITAGSLVTGDTLSGALSRAPGEDVNTYAITQNSLSAGSNYLITFNPDNFSITHLNITGDFTAADKIYDGNATATILTRTLIGNLPGDDVSLTGGSASFENMNVGNGKMVTSTAMSLSGAKALNYNLLSVDTASADITLRSLTITVDPGQTKVYGQINPASYTYQITSGTLVTGDTLSGALSRAPGEDVNTYAITQNSLSAGSNYLISFNPDNFSITHLNITGDFTAANKMYDGNATATILTRTLIGNLPGDDVSLTGGSANFDNKNVGNGKVVTFTGMSLSGTKALNYNLLSVDTASANITAKPASVSPTATSKTYGASDPALTGVLSGFISGDGITAIYTRVEGETVSGSPYLITADLNPDSALSNYTITYNTANFTINPASVSPVITFSVNPQQYSDTETFTLTIPGGAPLISGGPQAAQSASFYIGTQSLGNANLIISGSDLVATLSNIPLLEPTPFGTAPVGQMAPGARTVKAVINNPDNNYSFSTLEPTAVLNISKENSAAYYTGGEFASTGTATATTANIRLSATVIDTADSNRGDIRNALVRFKIQPYNCDISMTPGAVIYTRWRTVSLVNASDISTGTAVLDTSFNIGSCDAKIYDVTVETGNYYTGNSGMATITVAKSLNDFITGGGHLIVGAGSGNKTSGTYKSTDNSKTNWGFNVKYNKNKTNLQGNVNIIIRSGGKSYQVKGIVGGSNGALSVNTTDPSNMRATVTAKANMIDLSTGLAVNYGSNATMELRMSDKGEPGVNKDTYGITIWGSNNTLLYSSNWTGTTTGELPINGGNIQVKSTSSGRSMEESEAVTTINADSVDPEKPFIIYPNPNTGMFTVEICRKDISESAQIEVTNSVGQLVYTKIPQVQDGCIKEIMELDNSLPDGIYFIHLKIGQKDQMMKMMLMK